MPKQVWGCKSEKHDFFYEAPLGLIDLVCPMGHQGVLVEGDPIVLKPKKKRAKIQNVTKVVDKRSKVEKAIDKLGKGDGRVVATKVALF